MDHPFTSKPELTEQQLDAVYGGIRDLNIPDSDVEKLKSAIKPPFASTMAVGEEGGYFRHF